MVQIVVLVCSYGVFGVSSSGGQETYGGVFKAYLTIVLQFGMVIQQWGG